MARSFRLHRLLLVAMLHVVQRPRRVLALVAVVSIACGVLAFLRLGVTTDQDELFSSKVAFFKDYLDYIHNFPENQANYAVIEARDPAHAPPTQRWVAVADAVTAALKKQPQWVKQVEGHTPLDELGPRGLLLDQPEEVKQHFTETTQLAGAWAKGDFITRRFGSTPLIRFLNEARLAAPTADSAGFFKLLADGWTRSLMHPDEPITLGGQVPDLTALAVRSPRDLGYDYIPDETDPTRQRMLLLIPIYERDDFHERGAIANTIDGIRRTVSSAAASFPEFEVGMSGRPTLEADEMKTTDTDARRSEIAALTAVFVGLVILLRSIWLAVAAEIALLVGIAWTFGWATISIGNLNLLSMVFLIALTGIGMDYLIQILTRYRRESARRQSPRAIWIAVFKYVAAPINTACLGAAGAFLVALFTNFRGAAELGVIAGGGLVLCLVAGYLVLPPLLTIFPAKPLPLREKQIFEPPQTPGKRPARRHGWLLLPLVWCMLLLGGIPWARQAHFNPSLIELQASGLPSVQLVRKLPTWSAVVLSKNLDSLRSARTAVQKLTVVKETDSILRAFDNYDFLKKSEAKLPVITDTTAEPVTAADIPALISAVQTLAGHYRAGFTETAAALDLFTHALQSTNATAAASRLSLWQQVFLEQLKNLLLPFRPEPFDPSKLPTALREHYIGADGRYALNILPNRDLWVQDDLRDFTLAVESAVARSQPNAPAVTGISVEVYHSTSSIEKSFYHATAYALGLIFLLVLIDLRNFSQTILAISVLAMGLPMLVALMGWLGINWNFANFFGLPILIGAGHEYGVFMVHRYNEACGDVHRAWRNWDVSDRALLLCGYVTSVSFGFFWALGHHEGMKSLGLVMALGTACIYLATLCVLRPLLLWKLGRRGGGDCTPTSDPS